MTKSATLESDKIKGKLDYWRGELKELEATTKIKTRENFEEIKKGCEEKVSLLVRVSLANRQVNLF